jgi:GDP-mannose 4,6-dehydratase
MVEQKKTKSLITGINGFVASHLADYLLEQGEEVYGTARWTEDNSNIKHIKDKITIIPMDLNDLSSCIKCIEQVKPNYIFHLAAQSDPRESFSLPIETIRTNTLGTLNLLEAIRIVRDRKDNMVYDSEWYEPFNPVIHVCSSSEVYGLVRKEDVPIKETQQFNPANPYAVGKVGEDMIALMYFTNYELRTIRTRMFTHTGPRRKMLSAEVNFAMQIAKIEKGLQEPIVYHGNLDSIRTWADVRDAVKAYWLLVRKCKSGEVYNIGGKTTKTIGECLDYLISLSPMKDIIKKQLDPKLLRPYDVTLQIPDCYKFINETGWTRTITFEQTMQDLLDWCRHEV